MIWQVLYDQTISLALPLLFTILQIQYCHTKLHAWKVFILLISPFIQFMHAQESL